MPPGAPHEGWARSRAEHLPGQPAEGLPSAAEAGEARGWGGSVHRRGSRSRRSALVGARGHPSAVPSVLLRRERLWCWGCGGRRERRSLSSEVTFERGNPIPGNVTERHTRSAVCGTCCDEEARDGVLG